MTSLRNRAVRDEPPSALVLDPGRLARKDDAEGAAGLPAGKQRMVGLTAEEPRAYERRTRNHTLDRQHVRKDRLGDHGRKISRLVLVLALFEFVRR